jgi:carboxypeptidase Q
MNRRLALVLVLGGLAVAPAPAQEKLDWATLGRIRDEGFRHSQVMEAAAQLTDVHGPRLTGSPKYKEAADWARQQLETWGLANAHLESWPFGRGWSFERCSARVVSPTSFPLFTLPKAWTAGTDGPVRGKVMRVKVESEADVEALKGKVAGMVLWVGQPRDLKGPEDGGVFKRYTEKQLDDIEQYQIPGARGGRGPMGPGDREAFLKRRRLQQALEKLYAAEKPLAVFEPSERDADVLRLGGGGSRKVGDPQAVTQLVVAAEEWNRVARLLDRKMEIEVEIDVKAAFHEGDPNGYNVVADLLGTDKRAELVMVGAHLDSWHPGTGATDDAAGSAVMMEVVRILKAIDAKPRRTIRIGLWGGEEQGFLGSRAYVSEHFASRPEPKEPGADEMPSFMRNEPPAPMTLKPDHAKLSAYFNLDNGTGKIRGIYLQENAAVKPIFEAWMGSVKDLGATRITMQNTGGTDHIPFDGVGLPGFQFIQDPIEYMDGTFFGTHHTNMDVYDRLQREDLMQAAVVIATFAYDAAMRDELLPRKPLPPVAPPPAAPATAGKAGAKGAKPGPRAVEAAPGAGAR